MFPSLKMVDQDSFCYCISVGIPKSPVSVGPMHYSTTGISVRWCCSRYCGRSAFLSSNITLQFYPCSCILLFLLVDCRCGL